MTELQKIIKEVFTEFEYDDEHFITTPKVVELEKLLLEKVGRIEPLVIPKIAEEVFDQIHNILCESKFGMNDPKARVKILKVIGNILLIQKDGITKKSINPKHHLHSHTDIVKNLPI